MYDLDNTIVERRSVRGFLPKPVPREVLEEVLTLAQRAPSNCNVQPWRVYIASGKTLERLRSELVETASSGKSQAMSGTVDDFFGAYRDKQVACAVELYGNMGIARDDRAGRKRAMLRNFEFFDAPHVAYVCMAKSFGIGVALDVGMYVQTLMLAMQSRGIASCTAPRIPGPRGTSPLTAASDRPRRADSGGELAKSNTCFKFRCANRGASRREIAAADGVSAGPA